MNGVPRQKLCEIVARHGRSVIEDPRRCEGLLRDYCGEYRREISALVGAVEEHAAADMLASPASTPREVLLARLAKRLCDYLALSEEAARWAVESWALALGVISEAELEALEQARARLHKTAITTTPDPPTVQTKQVTQSLPTHAPPTQTTFGAIVSANGGGDYATIGEALRAARPGARLLVRPGLYNEGIVIDGHVEIIGDGDAEDIIVRSTDASCVEMRADKAVVRGLTLRGRAAQSGKTFFAVDITRGALTLEACDISSDSLSCVAVRGAAADPIIRRCRIHDGADSGVYFFDGAVGRIEECDIYRNANVGVAITEGARPSVKGCRIFEGENAGVAVWQGGAGLIEDCEVFGNALAGVGISEDANPTLRRCNIHSGRNSGVFVHQNGRGLLEDCVISGHAEAEVAITRGGNTVIRGCTIHRGSKSGVFIRDESRALIERCNVYGNADAGVTIHGGSVVAMRQCNINRNGKVAVRVKEGSAASVEDCDLRGNLLAAWETESGVVVKRSGNRE
jgi:nitrous oxidase accessory protein NosD